MVEELARWKSALTNRTNDLQEVIKRILNDHNKLHNQMLMTFNNLSMVYEKTANKKCNLKTGNIMELGSTNLELSEEMTKILAVDNLRKDLVVEIHDNAFSPTEKLALKVNNVELIKCNNLMFQSTFCRFLRTQFV